MIKPSDNLEIGLLPAMGSISSPVCTAYSALYLEVDPNYKIILYRMGK